MSRLAAIKYPEDSTNRSYQVSRQRWISHYVRQIQLAIANGAAPAISLTIRNGEDEYQAEDSIAARVKCRHASLSQSPEY